MRAVGDEEISEAFKKRQEEEKETSGTRVRKDRGKRGGRRSPERLSERKS